MMVGTKLSNEFQNWFEVIGVPENIYATKVFELLITMLEAGYALFKSKFLEPVPLQREK